MSATEASRRADLAAIHVLKKQLGWDEDTYRDVMAAVCRGIRSASELDVAGRAQFLAHLRRCVAANGGQAAPARKPLSPMQRKVWAMWMQVADAGLVKNRSAAALNAWIKRQTGVERLQWLQPAQLDLCIQSLKAWKQRGGEAA